MKALVVYDSIFGNTQKVTDVIAKELEAKVLPVSEALPGDARQQSYRGRRIANQSTRGRYFFLTGM
jgi:flavodoxin